MQLTEVNARLRESCLNYKYALNYLQRINEL